MKRNMVKVAEVRVEETGQGSDHEEMHKVLEEGMKFEVDVRTLGAMADLREVRRMR